MAFNIPPGLPLAPPAPPKPSPSNMTAAQASAMGTTEGAPATQTSKGPPPGSGLPGAGAPPPMPGMAPQVPPAGSPTSGRPVVTAHARKHSVGTHASRSPSKRVNPVAKM